MKVLVVDDDPDIVYIIRKILIKHGFDVVCAHSGKEALEKAEKEKPDLLLIDVEMPDLNGWEVAEKLEGKMEILIMSAGEGACIKKPFGEKELIEKIKEKINRTTEYPA